MTRQSSDRSNTLLCPSCEAENPVSSSAGEPSLFCQRCRFPLMLVANKYRLLRVLGRGGFGTVYEGRHIHCRAIDGPSDEDAALAARCLAREAGRAKGRERCALDVIGESTRGAPAAARGRLYLLVQP